MASIAGNGDCERKTKLFWGQMSTFIALQHTTTYRYDRPVILSPQVIRLRPTPHCHTEVHKYQLTISPTEHLVYWQQDAFCNHIARATFAEKVSELKLRVEMVANIASFNPFDFLVDGHVNQWPFDYGDLLKRDLQTYLLADEPGAKLDSFIQTLPREASGIINFLLHINRDIFERIEYIQRLDPGVQTCEESLRKASGSCRDSAWLLVQTFRNLGLAARFVSGYLIQLAQKTVGSHPTTQIDSADLHAWAELYIPGAGWLGLDPTSGLLASEGYIPLCCTRAPAAAAPVTGTTEPGNSLLHFESVITRLPDRPNL
ncbi:MAG: transglutaminase family protein [Pseudomonadales bacterium]